MQTDPKFPLCIHSARIFSAPGGTSSPCVGILATPRPMERFLPVAMSLLRIPIRLALEDHPR